MSVTLIDHPLARHLLTQLRDANTPPSEFRMMSNRIATILALECTKTLNTHSVKVTTPLDSCHGEFLSDPIVLVPVLRAGLGLLPAFLDLYPRAQVGFVGLERDENTAIVRSYYQKLPEVDDAFTIILDPMLATGGTAKQTTEIVKKQGCKKIVVASILAAAEGLDVYQEAFPDITIFTIAIDERLDDKKFIVPGLGDYGDRLFGT
jgi:uracil phosphoribosyltransferase